MHTSPVCHPDSLCCLHVGMSEQRKRSASLSILTGGPLCLCAAPMMDSVAPSACWWWWSWGNGWPLVNLARAAQQAACR